METRTCQNCGKPIVKRENENNFRYKTRKYCSDECYHTYMREHKLGWYRGFGVKHLRDSDPIVPIT
jgi:endogenous inhibitor of DNA gyrase (YacG/DUF329 family)